MLAIGRLAVAPHLHQQTLFAHDAQHVLVIDQPPLPVQFCGHAPVAIARKLQRNLLAPSPQLDLFHGPLLIIVRAGSHFQQPTEQTHRKFLLQPCYDFPSLREREGSSRETFFEAASSIVSWPTSRSSSAMRSCSADCCCLVANTCGARSRKFCFQCVNRSGAILCSRQICASVFCRLSASSTICTFKSALYVRYLPI